MIKLEIERFWINILSAIKYFILPILGIIVIMNFIKIDGILNVLIFGFIYTILYIIVLDNFVINSYEKGIINSFVFKIIRRSKND